MKQSLLLMLLALGIYCINGNAQTKKPVRKTTTQVSKSNNLPKDSREYQVGKDGFEWYKVCKKGKWGAEDRIGNVLVPCEYDKIEYQEYQDYRDMTIGCGFVVVMGQYYGYYSREGKCVIPYTKHYTSAYKVTYIKEQIGTMYCCTLDDCTVFCNAQGEEVCRFNGRTYFPFPIYEKGKFYYRITADDKYGIADGNGHTIINVEYSCITSNSKGDFTASVNGEERILGNLNSIYTTKNPFENNPVEKPNTQMTSSSSSLNNNTNSNGNSNFGGGTTTVVVEHHRDPVPVQQWQACWACGGMGTMGCDGCGGSGTKYIGNNLRRCSLCNGQGIRPCNICYGNKGQYITVYQ